MAIKVNAKRVANAPLPAGMYRAYLEAVEQREGTNAPYLAVRLRVVDPAEFAGEAIFENVSLSEKARWRLEQFLDAFGVPDAEEFDLEELIGTTVVVALEEQKQKDQAGNEVIRVRVARWMPNGEYPGVDDIPF